MTIRLEVRVKASPETAWRAWTRPEDIQGWNAASDDWHTTAATVDLREGGTFSARMEAKDGSMGFDFAGTYTKVAEPERLEYRLDDGRSVTVEFTAVEGGTRIVETFEPETSNPVELQRQGWQAILDNFARHVDKPA